MTGADGGRRAVTTDDDFPDPGQVTTQASAARAPGDDRVSTGAAHAAVTAQGLAAESWPDPGQDDVTRDARR